MNKSFFASYFPFFMAVVAVAALGLGLKHQTSALNEAALRETIQGEVEILQARLQSQVENSELITRGIASLLSRDEDISQSEFSMLVTGVTKGRDDVLNVAWAPDLVVTRVHPMEPNRSVLGLDYRTVPDQLNDVSAVRDSGQTAFIGPINLVQGGQGFILRMPVYSRDQDVLEFRGILSTVFDLNLFLDRAGLMGDSLPLDLVLVKLDANGQPKDVAYGNEDVLISQPVSAAIDFLGAKWLLCAIPLDGWSAAQERTLSQTFLIMLLCGCILGPLFLLNRMALSRKVVIENMRHANLRLDSFIQNFPGVFVTYVQEKEKRDQVVFATDSTLDIWGVPKETLYASPGAMWKNVPKEEEEPLVAAVQQARDSGTTWHHVWPNISGDGSTRWLEGWGRPYSVGPDKVRWDCFVMDVTDQRLKELEFERQADVMRQAQKQESIGQLTGGMAHDFNNMLAVIRGNMEMLQEDLEPELDADDERLEFVRGSIRAAEQGNDLTKKMLSFARRARLNPETINLNDVLRELEGWSGRTLPATIRVTKELTPGLPLVRLDRSSTASAVLNLMVNARDAMADGGTLTLATRNQTLTAEDCAAISDRLTPGRYVVLSVTDTGQGIREEDLSKICEPFYTTKAPGAGSGLGLSMVYGFVAQSGGALEIQSCVGTGTTINLYFQALDIERTTFSQHPTQDGRVARTQYHILLAEDHEDVRRMLERSLSRMGHKVTSAENGDKALALFDADPQVDLLLTDIVMPGRLQGTDLVKALRERRTNFPAIVMTGYTDVPLHEGSVLNTDDIRLSKPVARASLEAAIAITMKRVRSF